MYFRQVWSCGLVALAVIGATTFAQPPEHVIDRIVAVVDNEILLESELFQYVQYQVGSAAALEAMSKGEIDSLKRLILEELISQKVLLAKARADTVAVSTREVDTELDRRIKLLIEQAGGAERLEEYYGMPLARIKRQFRLMVEEGMMIEKLKQDKLAKVAVSPSDVQHFWEQYRDSIPPLRDAVRVAHILLQDTPAEGAVQAAVARADSARQRILAKEMTFEEFASRYSEDPNTATRGGKLGQTHRGELVPAYEAAAYGMEPGQISEPVISPFGVHVIRLDERLGEKITTSHVLFKIVPTDEDRARTRARADSMVTAIRAGADFVQLVEAYSVDAKTVGKGGDLGWFSPADLPPEFKQPLEGLKKGAITEPVRSQFGLHVLMVEDRTYARPVTLDEDYDRVARMALAKKKDDVMAKWVAELSAETYIERK